MSNTNNPAGRLYNFLIQARKNNGDRSIREVWASIAGIDPSDKSNVLRFVADLIILSQEARVAIEKLENIDHQIYLSPFIRINDALGRINLEDRWETISRYLDEPTMVALAFCADTLSRTGSDNNISEEDLDKLKSEINDLLEQVIDLDISQELKDYLVEQLEKMRAAVVGYKIYGNKGLKQVLESIFGATLLHQDAIRSSMVEEKNKPIWAKFWKSVENLANVATIIEVTKALSGPVAMLLTSGK